MGETQVSRAHGLEVTEHEARALARGDHSEPHRVLGAHPASRRGRDGVVVRAFHPDATAVDLVLQSGETRPMERIAPGGLFGVFCLSRAFVYGQAKLALGSVVAMAVAVLPVAMILTALRLAF